VAFLVGCSGSDGAQGPPGGDGDDGEDGADATGTITGVTNDVFGNPTNAPTVWALYTGPVQGIRPSAAVRPVQVTPSAVGDFEITVAPGTYTVYAATTANGVNHVDLTEGVAEGVVVTAGSTIALPDALVAPQSSAPASFSSNGSGPTGGKYGIQLTTETATWKFSGLSPVTTAGETQIWTRLEGTKATDPFETKLQNRCYWLTPADALGTAGTLKDYKVLLGTAIDKDSPLDPLPTGGAGKLPAIGGGDDNTRIAFYVQGKGGAELVVWVDQTMVWVAQTKAGNTLGTDEDLLP